CRQKSSSQTLEVPEALTTAVALDYARQQDGGPTGAASAGGVPAGVSSPDTHLRLA
ncbi:hypothetical protein V5799_012855, partial [Amblyomma americanum]